MAGSHEPPPVNVLNVNTDLDPVSGGGTAERTYQMSRALARAGAGCDVLVLDMGLSPERVKGLAGARVVAMPRLSRRFYVPKPSLGKIRDAVASADIIHLMGHWTLLNALAYLYARRLNKPYVVCPAGALPVYGRSRLLKRVYNRLIGNRIVRGADAHVAITGGELPQFKAYGVAPDRVTVIPNGVDPADYPRGDGQTFRRKHDLEDHPYVLFVGRLNHIKGPDLLLEAFREAGEELRDHRLVFAGPDEGMLDSLRETAARFGVKVRFVGHVGGREKAEAYRAARLLVVPSRQEAMSIVALEAGVCGTPVLITDRCGFDEVQSAGGGRVAPATVEGLRGGLVALLEDPTELRRMGSNLRKLVKERYTWDSIVVQYLDLYDRILERGAR